MRRREFLISCLTTGTAIKIGQVFGASRTLRSPVGGQPFKVGIVGLGGKGLRYLVNCESLTGFATSALCDLRDDALKKAVSTLPNTTQSSVSLHTDFRDLIATASIDAVLIATPVECRAEVAIASCAAGKHVIIEGPWATTISESNSIMEASSFNNVFVQQKQSEPVWNSRELHELVRPRSSSVSQLCITLYRRRTGMGIAPNVPYGIIDPLRFAREIMSNGYPSSVVSFRGLPIQSSSKMLSGNSFHFKFPALENGTRPSLRVQIQELSPEEKPSQVAAIEVTDANFRRRELVVTEEEETAGSVDVQGSALQDFSMNLSKSEGERRQLVEAFHFANSYAILANKSLTTGAQVNMK